MYLIFVSLYLELEGLLEPSQIIGVIYSEGCDFTTEFNLLLGRFGNEILVVLLLKLKKILIDGRAYLQVAKVSMEVRLLMNSILV